MPYIQEETVTVKLYKLHKGQPEDLPQLTNNDFVTNLEAIVQELAGENVVIEINKE